MDEGDAIDGFDVDTSSGGLMEKETMMEVVRWKREMINMV